MIQLNLLMYLHYLYFYKNNIRDRDTIRDYGPDSSWDRDDSYGGMERRAYNIVPL